MNVYFVFHPLGSTLFSCTRGEAEFWAALAYPVFSKWGEAVTAY
jgi:hypothetical protein